MRNLSECCSKTNKRAAICKGNGFFSCFCCNHFVLSLYTSHPKYFCPDITHNYSFFLLYYTNPSWPLPLNHTIIIKYFPFIDSLSGVLTNHRSIKSNRQHSSDIFLRLYYILAGGVLSPISSKWNVTGKQQKWLWMVNVCNKTNQCQVNMLGCTMINKILFCLGTNQCHVRIMSLQKWDMLLVGCSVWLIKCTVGFFEQPKCYSRYGFTYIQFTNGF